MGASIGPSWSRNAQDPQERRQVDVLAFWFLDCFLFPFFVGISLYTYINATFIKVYMCAKRITTFVHKVLEPSLDFRLIKDFELLANSLS